MTVIGVSKVMIRPRSQSLMLIAILVFCALSLCKCSLAPWLYSGASPEPDHDSGAAILLTDDDLRSSSNSPRLRRYILSDQKWPYRKITWKLANDHLSAGDRYVVRNALHRAFRLWQSASSLRFKELEDEDSVPETDITIAFAKGDHGDKLPFDGKYGIVAHAFYPTEGLLHFDADELWTMNSKEGIDLYQTAVHEIGHLVGLEHSTDERAVMYPANRAYDPEYTLADDDVRGVRRLYPISRKASNEFLEDVV